MQFFIFRYKIFFLLGWVLLSSIESLANTDELLISNDSIRIDTFARQNLSGIAAITLSKDRLEANVFSSFVYNQKLYNFFFDPPVATNDRQDVLSTWLQLTYGTSKKRNFNIGLDLNSTNLFYKPFLFPNQQFSIIKIGPRLRWRPLGSRGESFDIVLQNAVYFKIHDNQSLLKDELEFSNQLFFFKYLFEKKLVLQSSLGFTMRPKSSSSDFDRKRPFEIPLTLFVGFFPRRDIILFSYLNHSNELGTLPISFNKGYRVRRNSLNVGLGGQITFNYRLSVYLIPQFSVLGKNGGKQNQISLGIRYLY